ncbi:MAG: MIP/aquaporin family protein [Longimicrobiales bacterium]|jgi:aquaporin Z
MVRYATELIGTFCLVFTIGMTAVAGVDVAPIAIGAILTALVYMGGHVSGAHYNPSISIALYLRGALDAKHLAPYIAAQLLGACLAAGAVLMITGGTFAPAPGEGYGTLSVLLAEMLMTFALALVIMNVATSKATEGNSYYGLAIGFTVMAGAFAVGGVSGGVFNPAVGFGPILVDMLAGDGGFGNLWFYIVGPIVGAAAAVPVFKMQEGAGDAEA